MAETNVADVAEKTVIDTPVAEDEEDTEDWRIQAEAFKSEGRLLRDILRAQLMTGDAEVQKEHCCCCCCCCCCCVVSLNFAYLVNCRFVLEAAVSPVDAIHPTHTRVIISRVRSALPIFTLFRQ